MFDTHRTFLRCKPGFVRMLTSLALLTGLASTTTMSSTSTAVDMALVLAVDCSDSVDRKEFRQQIDGIARALRDPAVLAAIQTGPTRRIAVTLLQWSDFPQPAVTADWAIIEDTASANAFANDVANSRRSAVGGTSIATAIDGGLAQLSRMPWRAIRQVIDVSGDGTNNAGDAAKNARNRALARGVVVNGLAITNNFTNLVGYFEEHVSGGPGNFVIRAADYNAFPDAMLRKLVREISSPVS